MKRNTTVIFAVFFVLIMAGCAQPKPAPETRENSIKARVYDMGRQINRMEKELDIRTGTSKKLKAKNMDIRKNLESAGRDLDEMQDSLDKLGMATGQTWEEVTLGMELGADRLGSKIGNIIKQFQERQDENKK